MPKLKTRQERIEEALRDYVEKSASTTDSRIPFWERICDLCEEIGSSIEISRAKKGLYVERVTFFVDWVVLVQSWGVSDRLSRSEVERFLQYSSETAPGKVLYDMVDDLFRKFAGQNIGYNLYVKPLS